jgi:hypothetical protein
LIGDIIFQSDFSGSSGEKAEVDVSFLSTGIYFIKAGNEVRKFVKQ